MKQRQPSFFIPHGGGPCFFMDDPMGVWTDMEAFLRTLPDRLPQRPDALLLISGHWETRGFTFSGRRDPPLIYDYYGFPPHTYELEYPAPGAPELAGLGAELMRRAGLPAIVNADRGFDHGIFVPMKVAFPGADIPIAAMSLDSSLDPALHLAAGRALAPLRDVNVVVIGSGMSFHNMAGYRDPAMAGPSRDFDDWLTAGIAAPAPERDAWLQEWTAAPGGRASHPREEHLLPLMVVAGTSEVPGERIFAGHVLDKRVSGFQFN